MVPEESDPCKGAQLFYELWRDFPLSTSLKNMYYIHNINQRGLRVYMLQAFSCSSKMSKPETFKAILLLIL